METGRQEDVKEAGNCCRGAWRKVFGKAVNCAGQGRELERDGYEECFFTMGKNS